MSMRVSETLNGMPLTSTSTLASRAPGPAGRSRWPPLRPTAGPPARARHRRPYRLRPPPLAAARITGCERSPPGKPSSTSDPAGAWAEKPNGRTAQRRIAARRRRRPPGLPAWLCRRRCGSARPATSRETSGGCRALSFVCFPVVPAALCASCVHPPARRPDRPPRPEAGRKARSAARTKLPSKLRQLRLGRNRIDLEPFARDAGDDPAAPLRRLFRRACGRFRFRRRLRGVERFPRHERQGREVPALIVERPAHVAHRHVPIGPPASATPRRADRRHAASCRLALSIRPPRFPPRGFRPRAPDTRSPPGRRALIMISECRA